MVYVVYPIYKPWYDLSKDGMAEYTASVKANMPAAAMIDFNTPEYDSLRTDPTNYIDEVHLSPTGSARFTPMLNTTVHRVLHDQ